MSIRGKLDRIARGNAPRVLDLFAGCGGLSLGFRRAGFEIVAAVENDPLAAASHALNFHGGDPRQAKARDITATSPAGLCDELGLGLVDEAVDVVVGGPPCQAFARVGRAKLREVDEHPEAFLHDPRAHCIGRPEPPMASLPTDERCMVRRRTDPVEGTHALVSRSDMPHRGAVVALVVADIDLAPAAVPHAPRQGKSPLARRPEAETCSE